MPKKEMEKHVYRIAGDGTYLGVTILDISDIDPRTGQMLVPARCVTSSPPLPKQGYKRIYDGQQWQYVAEEREEVDSELERQARKRRDALLRESDWTQLADAPLTATQKKEWKEYRRILREMPNDAQWPATQWPSVPK